MTDECPNKLRSAHSKELRLSHNGDCLDCGTHVRAGRAVKHYRRNSQSINRTVIEYNGEPE